MQYQILEWDSDFFRIKVAQITPPNLSQHKLAAIISELKKQDVKLVYWSSGQECNNDAVSKLCGSLVDRKTTFAIDFSSLDLKNIITTDMVEPFTDSMPVEALESLAIQSGEYSRFAIDSNLPKEKFFALYKTWINRSLRKEIANEVLVIRDADQIAGMVTLGEKNKRGDIGLIAVHKDFRGRKYGEKLVRAAQRWFITNGFEFGQVVTQGQNIAACNLYKKCGYSVEQIEYFYHFWL